MSPYRQRAREPRDRGKRETILYIRMCHLINVDKRFRLALMGQWVRPYHVEQVGDLADVECIGFQSCYLCPAQYLTGSK